MPADNAHHPSDSPAWAKARQDLRTAQMELVIYKQYNEQLRQQLETARETADDHHSQQEEQGQRQRLQIADLFSQVTHLEAENNKLRAQNEKLELRFKAYE